MENCRKQVVLGLTAFEKDKSYSNIVLDKLLEEVSVQERAFASTLFYGVIERRLTLDFIIKANSKLAFSKIKPVVLNILRTAVYQLLYMDSVTDYAAVNEAVALCRNTKNNYASGFVNALLRAFVRGGKSIDYSGLSQDFKLEIEYSIPVWLIDGWRADYGESAFNDILKASVEHPPVTLRVNKIKTTAKAVIASLQKDGFTVTQSDIEDCLFTNGNITASQAFKSGWIYAQDVSSQLCATAAAYYAKEKDNRVILDVCAAPGSKSFTVAQSLKDGDKLYAFDLHSSRVKLIRSAASRLGMDIITEIKDAAVFDADMPLADVILCDLPCSGFGVIRRKPEIRYKPQDSVTGLPALQSDILNNSARYLRKGGILIYSTCTLRKAENEDVALRFLAENSDFTAEILPDFITQRFGGESMVTMLPGVCGNDGFFIAAFRKM